MFLNLFRTGQGVAVYGDADVPDEQTERKVIGTGLSSEGELIPVVWDPDSGRYDAAQAFDNFLGIVFDDDEPEEEDTEEDTHATPNGESEAEDEHEAEA